LKTAPQISTLHELLEAGGLDPRFYDMGRRILPLSKETFLSFERTELPYPQPLQQQAWLALVLQTGEDPVVWFLRFPLDEQGKLLQAARDDFMFQLMERLGNLASQSEDQRTQIESALEQSPYAFQPKQERLAAFHAQLTVALGHPPSRYYEHAKRYFSGELGWDQWSFIGYQGIADMAARYAEDDNTPRLATAIPHLPPTPFEALCHVLENQAIPTTLAQALLERTRAALASDKPDPQVLSAALRGISFSTSINHRKAVLKAILEHPVARRSDLLAAVAGRAWHDLEDADLRGQFLEQLACNDQGQDFFDQLLGDLLFMADCRPGLRESLRNPHRSEQLSQAIGAFFSRIKAD
jgi:hypothetical protein